MGAVAGSTSPSPPVARRLRTVREVSRPAVSTASALFAVATPRATERLRCDCLSLPALRVRHAVVLTPRAQLQEGLEAVGVSSAEASLERNTVQVKFVLNRECLFGQQFFVVGNDPNLGLWDTSSAIPLEWSEGHVWTAQLDLPIGKPIKYKFILCGFSGEIEWQPGDDRVLQPWETTKLIVVTEEWGNAEKQKMSEEELGNEGELTIVDEELASVSRNMLADGSLGANEASITDESLEVSKSDKFILNADNDKIKQKQNTDDEAVLVPGLPREPTLVSGLPLSPISDIDLSESSTPFASNGKLAVVSEDGIDSTLNVKNKGNETPGVKEPPVEEPNEMASYNDRAIESNEAAKDSIQPPEVVRKDIQWGRETINKFLSTLGLFLGESA